MGTWMCWGLCMRMVTPGSSAHSRRLYMCFLEKNREEIFATHYAPVRCTSKLQDILSRIKAFMAISIERT